MRFAIAALGALLVCGGIAAAATRPASKPVAVTLPADPELRYPAGTGSDLAQRHCSACHSAAYSRTQPVLTTAQWRAEVVKMQKVYGAPIPDGDIDALTAYLVATYGKR